MPSQTCDAFRSDCLEKKLTNSKVRQRIKNQFLTALIFNKYRFCRNVLSRCNIGEIRYNFVRYAVQPI
jgi:hypothetical protein